MKQPSSLWICNSFHQRNISAQPESDIKIQQIIMFFFLFVLWCLADYNLGTRSCHCNLILQIKFKYDSVKPCWNWFWDINSKSFKCRNQFNVNHCMNNAFYLSMFYFVMMVIIIFDSPEWKLILQHFVLICKWRNAAVVLVFRAAR